MKLDDTIVVTGARGLVGSNLVNYLNTKGYSKVIPLTRLECDLTNFDQTVSVIKDLQPKFVFHTAGHIFGIMGNMKNQAKSYLLNTQINTNVIEASYQAEVEKIIAMGSGCVYPYPSPGLPLKEEMVWSGKPHGSEVAYAHSKRSMLAQLEAYKDSYDLDFAFVISGNLYGPGDKFDENYGHVTPSLISKFHKAKNNNSTVSVWGDGSAQRDFLYVEDVASALEVIAKYINGPVNMGSGKVNKIKDIVDIIAKYTNLEGNIEWDSSKPNGQDYRAYDLSKLFEAGFEPQFSLEKGLIKTFDWYSQNAESARS